MSNEDLVRYVLEGIGALFVVWHILKPIFRRLRRVFNEWFWRRVNREKIYIGHGDSRCEENTLHWHLTRLTERAYALEQKSKGAP